MNSIVLVYALSPESNSLFIFHYRAISVLLDLVELLDHKALRYVSKMFLVHFY